MDILISSLLLIVLLFSSGYFSASETALFSLSSMKIRTYQNSSNPRLKLISNLVLQPRDLLVTVFMLNTLVNILLQNVISHMYGESANWIFKIGVPFVLMLIIGEIIPKYIGIQNNVYLSRLVAPSINFFQTLLGPVRRFTIKITAPISRIMFFYLKKEPSISKDELEHVLKKSEEHGILHADDAELVWGYLNLQDTTVKEVMRPREEILFYSLQEPLTKLAHLFVDEHCSRVPVCKDTIENIEGIITAKNYFLNAPNIKIPLEVSNFLIKPYFVPESSLARTLLRRLDERNQEMAIVVDEYGSISGLITYEDLVEVVVGKITDYRDQVSLFTRAGPHEIIASGKLELSDFNEIFDTVLVSENMVTIGGWLTEQLDEIPKASSQYELEGFLFQILAADPNRIRRLYIRQLTKRHLPPKKNSPSEMK